MLVYLARNRLLMAESIPRPLDHCIDCFVRTSLQIWYGQIFGIMMPFLCINDRCSTPVFVLLLGAFRIDQAEGGGFAHFET